MVNTCVGQALTILEGWPRLQAIITKEDGGHSCSVISLTVSGNYMFSADRQGNIVVGTSDSS
jgi:hypothetical protein